MAALYNSVTESPHVSYRLLLTLYNSDGESVQLEHNGQFMGITGALLEHY